MALARNVSTVATVNSRSGLTALITNVSNMYTSLMNNTAYGKKYNDVTEKQWNNGKRWYDGISSVELVARCIYSENTRSEETVFNYDRIGIAMVIMNRVNNSSFPNTAYKVITQKSQFSGINPGNYTLSTSQTNNAKKKKEKSDPAWQQATMLASVLYYTSSRSDLSYIYTLPSGVNTQLYFLGYDTTYSNISFKNSRYYYNNNLISNAAIAGYGKLALTSAGYNYLKGLKNKHRTLFFDY